MKDLLGLLTVLGFTSIALGDITNFQVHELVHENYLFRLQITGDGSTSLDQKVSGTKVENSFSISATAAPGGGSPPAYTYTNWQIKEIPTITIGGNAISGLPAVPEYDDGYAPVVRYASTHFDHDSQIQIQVSTQVRGVIKVLGIHIYEGEWKTLNAYIRPKAYNVGKAWATRVLANGTDLGDTPPTYSLPHESKRGLDFFDGLLPDSKHKQIDESPKYWADASGLDARLVIGTFIHASTHGSPSGVAHSYTATISDWNTIYSYVDQGRTVPGPNLACMFACKTLGSETDTEAAKAFKVVNPSTGATILSKGYVGFEDDVYAVTAEFLTVPLVPIARISDTIAAFYGELGNGYMLGDAVQTANQSFPVYNVDFTNGNDIDPVALKIRGDARSRVKSVYRTANEEQSFGGNNRWYIILS